METHELIAALAADGAKPKRPRLALRFGVGVLLAGALMLATLGLRPDLAEALQNPLVVLKHMLPLVFAVIAGWQAFSTPSGDRPSAAPMIALVAVVFTAWAGAALSGGDIMGETAHACLISIPMIALPLGALLFLGQRHAVEPYGARRGLFIGLFSGGVAAAIYAFHCYEDAPAFYLLWYTLAVCVCGIVGRMAGKRMLNV